LRYHWIQPKKIRLNPTGSNHFETFFYAKINEERDRPGRDAGRLAPHFRAKMCSARRQTPRARRTRSSFEKKCPLIPAYFRLFPHSQKRAGIHTQRLDKEAPIRIDSRLF
jgi:hypothetical protein